MRTTTKKKTIAKKTAKTTARKMDGRSGPRSAAHNRKISEGMKKHYARKKRAAKKLGRR